MSVNPFFSKVANQQVPPRAFSKEPSTIFITDIFKSTCEQILETPKKE